MVLGTISRPLLVPAADVLAKNMRAYEKVSSSSPLHRVETESAVNVFMKFGSKNEQKERFNAPAHVRFRADLPPSRPNPLTSLLSRLFKRTQRDATNTDSDAPKKSALSSTLQKLWPQLESASAAISQLPDPSFIFITQVAFVLLFRRFRPHWFDILAVKLLTLTAFFPVFVLALLWRKNSLFALLKEGQNPQSHPAEHVMDDLEQQLESREEKLRQAEQMLIKNRAELDALRKELAADPNAGDPDAIIVPSRTAAEMIAAGALGAGYDAEAAQAVEERRREESVKKSREEWRQKAEDVEANSLQTERRVKRLQDHASTHYAKRTHEIKTRSATGLRTNEKLKKVAMPMLMNRANTDEGVVRNARYSERSVGSATHSTTGKKWGLFRRKRRNTIVSNSGGGRDEGGSMVPSPRKTTEVASDRAV